ncbi:hypothetical protein [Streptomyces sp. RKAG293]|uniref:hypothetical protein n=1 Tax=Streptomyces sp. RKAG293 TaxID=2893403 RepID=UPI0020345D6C|nr:hypothetical protein [Streptomyces sp. RKAG293]MCM2417573.1 hypothetical protein [Streptomyces sp. RKAG293]
MSQDLPAVAPAVTAEIVGALSPRLRKRLDAAAVKIAARPAVRDGDTVRIAVDDEISLELHAPAGVVTTPDAIRCGCLLAPDCLHRAAVASAAPVADDEPAPSPNDTDANTAANADSEAAPAPEGASEDVPTPEQRAAAGALWAAGAAVLDAGIEGAGAVLQAELLRAAHAARLGGLPRPAAAAVSVVNGLRAARSADPAHRLGDLTAAVRELLATAHRLPDAGDSELAALRGTARQAYVPDGSLRLYGLFTEPLITAGGYAGATTWAAAAGGRLYTVSDIAPGGPGRAAAAADRTVRLGDTALTHRELSRAGLALSGATVSPTGRLGAGAAVKAVRAAGAVWTAEPIEALWAVPAAEQVARALRARAPGAGTTHAGADLLFLDVTILGAARETGGDCLLAACDELTLRLTAAHDHPALAHRDNLRMLAALPGARLRIVGRLVPAPQPRLHLLAIAHPADPERRVDMGLDRLQRADLPVLPPPAGPGSGGEPLDQAPLHLLHRRLEQAVAAGRRFLAVPGSLSSDAHRLRRSALPTAADLLAALQQAATERTRDPFGRLLPADTTHFARAWLGAALYAEAAENSLCAAAWQPPGAAAGSG